jgi:hypothetical protein
MQLIDQPVSVKTLSKIAIQRFGDLVKAVVDVNKEIMVIDASLHADEEAYLIKSGSDQRDLWGINIYPSLEGDDFIEFDSMINLRPSQDNITRGVDNLAIQTRIRKIVNMLIKQS